MKRLIFPKDFKFGTATSAYQIEGACNEDGKGESIWDVFTHKPGTIIDGTNGDFALDHYHRYKEDIKLLSDLHIQTYRFSISWPRIFPAGNGGVNAKGLDFYKRLVDELLACNISPAATLYHWDLPQKLQEVGGWENRDTIKYFEEYCNVMFDALGNSVTQWITHNEPWVISFVGNAYGTHAPGNKDWQKALAVAHNVLVSHGKVVKNFREKKLNGAIGITLNFTPSYASSDSAQDMLAQKLSSQFESTWFLEPLFKKKYPEDLFNLFKEKYDFSFIQATDMEIIGAPIDFLGVNYYTRSIVKFSESDLLKIEKVKNDTAEYTASGWEVYPEGIYDTLMMIKNGYTDIDLYITENGCAYNDTINGNERIHDVKRISYLKAHLANVQRAMHAGAPVKGYYLWSFLDNFEWAEGYEKRFGIVFIDYGKNTRTVKDSGHWYRDTITSR